MADGHRDRERRVGSDSTEVRWRDKLGRGYVFRGGNYTHRCGIARTCLDLLAIRDRRANGCAKVYEVVTGGQRRRLTGGGLSLPVALRTNRDQCWIKIYERRIIWRIKHYRWSMLTQGRLQIPVVTAVAGVGTVAGAGTVVVASTAVVASGTASASIVTSSRRRSRGRG